MSIKVNLFGSREKPSNQNQIEAIVQVLELIGNLAERGSIKQIAESAMPHVATLVRSIRQDVLAPLVILYNTEIIAMCQDEGYETQQDELRKIETQRLRKEFDCLVKAGFTSKQAMDIIIARQSRPQNYNISPNLGGNRTGNVNNE